MKKNPIEAIKILSKLPNLETLNLKSCGLKSLPKIILEFKSLKHLNLDNNPQLNLDTIFYLLSDLELESLNLSSSKFTVLPKSIERLTSLKRLELELVNGNFNNEASFSNISLLVNLQELNIQGNFFGKLNSGVEKLKFLKILEIDGNCIVGKNFELLKKLLPNTIIQNEIPC